MRGVLLALVLLAAVVTIAPQPVAASHTSSGTAISASASAGLQTPQTPGKDINVDININQGGNRWWRNPVWVAIGAVAAVIVLLLIVLIARSGGGGTTIVKD